MLLGDIIKLSIHVHLCQIISLEPVISLKWKRFLFLILAYFVTHHIS